MKTRNKEAGNTIIIALGVVVVLSALVGIAADYTTNVGRNAQRSRVIGKAVEVGDGALEIAFASWRKVCSTQSDPTVPLSATSFAAIPTPSPGNFPMLANLTISRNDEGATPVSTISNFRVDPVDPLLNPLPAASPAPTPTKSTGPGTGTFSYFYLASADVTVPALKGSLTAKVRRVFEQRVTSPWNWAIMFNDDLELSPTSNLTLNGWVHTNGKLYTPSSNLNLTDRLSYVSDWNIGWDPSDVDHAGSTASNPNSSPDYPPGFEKSYVPFGWDPTSLINTGDLNANNDSYRELIEKPTVGTDPWTDTRFWNQAAIAVEIDAANNITVWTGTGDTKSNSTLASNSGTTGTAAKAILGSGSGSGSTPPSIIPNRAIQDGREQGAVRVVDFDLGRFLASYGTTTTKGWNGIIYIRDTSAGLPATVTLPGGATSITTKRAIRIINGASVPNGGITIASENPVYIQGDLNTGRTSSRETPSNTGDYSNPEAQGYNRQPVLVAADAVTLLSNSWRDSNSTGDLSTRIASNTTINAAIVAGNVPTNADGTGHYSGGAENFIRLLEDWTTNNNTFTYYGSMIQFFRSAQANQPWTPSVYSSPALKWYFDTKLTTGSPPSTTASQMATVSYLQQQRWFVTFQPNG